MLPTRTFESARLARASEVIAPPDDRLSRDRARLAPTAFSAIISVTGPSALVAQWIEQRFPKPRAEVRFLPGAPNVTCRDIVDRCVGTS
jgi:hypothetical protein